MALNNRLKVPGILSHGLAYSRTVIGGRTVLTRDGAVWHVGRRVTPWRPVWLDGMRHHLTRLARTPVSKDPNFVNLHGETLRSDSLGPWVVMTMLAAVFEALAMLVVCPFYVPVYVLTRFLGRRPWTVSAHRVGSRRHREWNVRGWRESASVIDEIVEDLERQRTPKPQLAERRGAVVSFREWVS